jgi:hypothetical protein
VFSNINGLPGCGKSVVLRWTPKTRQLVKVEPCP